MRHQHTTNDGLAGAYLSAVIQYSVDLVNYKTIRNRIVGGTYKYT